MYGTFAISKVKLFSFPALKGLKNEILQKTGDLEFHEAYGSENIKWLFHYVKYARIWNDKYAQKSKICQNDKS